MSTFYTADLVYVSGSFEPGVYLEVDDGEIIGVTATKPTPQASIQSFPGHAIFPGAVNTHCHSYLSLLRGELDELPLAAWLAEVYREVAVFDASAAYLGARPSARKPADTEAADLEVSDSDRGDSRYAGTGGNE